MASQGEYVVGFDATCAELLRAIRDEEEVNAELGNATREELLAEARAIESSSTENTDE